MPGLSEGGYVGARWWKVDFHSHTPASIDYGGGPDQAQLKSTTPEDWLLTYMRAKIDAVVVTDHNSGEWIDRLKLSLSTDEIREHPDFRTLYVFPGVEMTASGGVHVLGIFDLHETGAKITYLMGSCKNPGIQGDPASTCEDSAESVVKKIFEAGGVAILAHVDTVKGAFTELPGATLVPLVEKTPLYAYEQIDPAVPLPQVVAARVSTWAQVVGSDSHHLNPGSQQGSRFPGSHYTWVKMDTPNLEGLRLALLDGNGLSVKRFDSVAGNPNEPPELWIEGMVVSNASVMGRGNPLRIAFSPRLDVIVGGRGSGKSTLVEMMRVGTGRSDELPSALQGPLADYYGEQRMKEGKGAYTPNTRVEITLNSHGTRFRLDIAAPTLDVTTLRQEENGDWVPSVGSIHDRFPVRIFSQKQIYEMATNRAGLLRQVDQHESVEYDAWKEAWDRLTSEFFDLGRKLRELEKRVNERPKTVGALEDVDRKLKVFETMGHEAILKEHNRRQAQFGQFKEAFEDLANIVKSTEALLPELKLSEFDASLFDMADPYELEAKALFDEARSVVEDYQKEFRERAASLAVYAVSLKEKVRETQFFDAVKMAGSKYRELTNELAEQGVANLNLYGALVQQQQILRKTLSDIDALPPTIKGLSERRTTLLAEIEAWRREITRRRQEFLVATVGGNPLIRMSVTHCGSDPVTTELQWRQVLSKPTNMQEPWLSDDGKQGMVAELYLALPKERLAAETEISERVAKLKREVEQLSENKNSQNRKQWITTYFRFLPPETLDHVRLWWPEDSLEIDFRVSEHGNDYKPVRDGSPGQRTAAVLAFLLSYGTEPMILDQPEDDLDNHLIYDLIVTQLRENKKRRQVIVVTHNANIVVNGDAEYVIPMEYRGGQCRVAKPTGAGSLQSTAIRDEVCRVMEGGRVAFEKRYRRMYLDSHRV